jgi:hypothetical protein
MTQPADKVQVRYVPAPPRKPNRVRTVRRITLLILWFALMLLPLFFIIMVTQGQVIVPLGDAPEHELRVWLVSEARMRGFGIANAWEAARTETAVCVEHDVRFLLWMGEQEPSRYCECFARADASAAWSFESGGPGECEALAR